jgi:hypothetical protein
MQVNTKIEVVISEEEIKEILAKHLSIGSEFKLTIVNNIYNSVDNSVDNDWIPVPKDWKYRCCPDADMKVSQDLVLKYRNNEEETQMSGIIDGDYWVQEDSPYDIVAYRKV